MDLLQSIKSKRAKQKKKDPVARDVFTRVGWIVRQNGLDEGFLRMLDPAANDAWQTRLGAARVRLKTRTELPLFFLATQEEYRLIRAILRAVDNPYLEFANTPDEILWCRYLFRLNPAIPQDRLIRFHFETLVLHEQDKVGGGLAGVPPPGTGKRNLSP
ncbi:hypothetical protein [Desulfoferrobacter suflitae]|uniref:hypothetical protein n=1 Tax=Desulfoferrobacter suflitae TaxID=2865782 RepID=UPI00216460A6|nr:hypothetical protein [Desulfoferrobacter suflitae]MCK8602233.1 hypothetical protein [Desulfoferrobacter suflitae]